MPTPSQTSKMLYLHGKCNPPRRGKGKHASPLNRNFADAASDDTIICTLRPGALVKLHWDSSDVYSRIPSVLAGPGTYEPGSDELMLILPCTLASAHFIEWS
ncbi:hypothetical protein Bbelb_264120 [Branchiostoma belcheri]|nr:hypothetical protein Bbelb_264120 [Branchiostoma belcheri]